MAIKHFGILLVFCALIGVCLGNTVNGKIAELEAQLIAYDENWNNATARLKSLQNTISTLLRGAGEISDESHESELDISIRLANGNKHSRGSPGLPGQDGQPGQAGPAGAPGVNGSSFEEGGVVYTRWGRTECGDNSTVIYTGYTGAGRHDRPGGGVNYQCMPDTPEYNSDASVTNNAFLAGTEYESGSFGVFPDEAHNQNAPCAVCYTSNRPALMMIPAKRTCPDKWTKEYEGYLMSKQHSNNHQTTFECVDAEPEYVDGESADLNGGLFYFTRSECTKGTYCPPYHGSKAITCVVCTN